MICLLLSLLLACVAPEGGAVGARVEGGGIQEVSRDHAAALLSDQELSAMVLEIRRLELAGRIEDGRAVLREATTIVKARGDESPVELALLERLDAGAQRMQMVSQREALCSRLLSIRRATLPGDSPVMLRTQLELAEIKILLQHAEEARVLLEEAVAIQEESGALGPSEARRARILLARSLHAYGATQSARELLEEVLEGLQASSDDEHEDSRVARLYLAWTLLDLGLVDEAQDLHAAVVAEYKRTAAPGHIGRLEAFSSRARVLLESRDLLAAKEILEEVLVAREQSLPSDHPELLGTRLQLGMAMSGVGELRDATDLFEQLAPTFEEVFGADSGAYLMLRLRNALAWWDTGDLASAVAATEEVRLVAQRTIAHYEGTLSPGSPTLLDARHSLAICSLMLEAPGEALTVLDAALEVAEGSLPALHKSLITTRHFRGVTLAALWRSEEALAVHEELSQSLPEGHPFEGIVLHDLAVAKQAAGDLEGAKALFQSLVDRYDSAEPEGGPRRTAMTRKFAKFLDDIGDYSEAVPLRERVVSSLMKLRSEVDPDLLVDRTWLAHAYRRAGQLDRARDIQGSLLQTWERLLARDDDPPRELPGERDWSCNHVEAQDRVLEVMRATFDSAWTSAPENHLSLAAAQQKAAAAAHERGDYVSARAFQEQVLGTYVLLYHGDNHGLLHARLDLALTLEVTGELERARELLEQVVEVSKRTQGAKHIDHVVGLLELSSVIMDLGDLVGARELSERALVALRGTVPEDHPLYLSYLTNLATLKHRLGDPLGALALLEQVLEIRRRVLPDDDGEVVSLRMNVAAAVASAGDLERGTALLADLERDLAGVDFARVGPRLRILVSVNLAASRVSSGEYAEARDVCEILLEVHAETLGEDRALLCHVQSILGVAYQGLGELEAARAQQREVVSELQALLPPFHEDLLSARMNLAVTFSELGATNEAQDALRSLIDGMMGRLRIGANYSPREARATCDGEAGRLGGVLSLMDDSAAMNLAVTRLIETRRHIATWSAFPRHGTLDPELVQLRRRLSRVRGQIKDAVLGGPVVGQSEGAWRSDLAALTLDRDHLLAELGGARRKNESTLETIDPLRVAAALDEGDLAVGYLRYREWSSDTGTGRGGVHRLLAMVIHPDGRVRRLDLGLAGEVEDLVHAWRAAIGRAIVEDDARDGSRTSEEIGSELRKRLLDPILIGEMGLADSGKVYLCLDDVLQLIPLDALPLEGGDGPVGGKYSLRLELSFTRLVQRSDAAGTPPTPTAAPQLLAVGDVDFFAEPESTLATTLPVVACAPLQPATRRGIFGNWPRLPHTADEVVAITKSFADIFGTLPEQLTGRAASKEALYEAVPGKRYVHIATHGWFAPEQVLSSSEVNGQRLRVAPWRAKRAVEGLAPMALCGICMAGSNRGRDARGRVTGLLTAEEIASYDLSQCDLVVLSACETNVGLSRAGTGILSLRAALHAAGAKTTLTSLWSVPDELTVELMSAFYENLWRDGMSKSTALWEAKESLRRERRPVAAWAAWVLTGEE